MSRNLNIKEYVIDLLMKSQKVVYRLYKFANPEDKAEPSNKKLDRFRNALIHSVKRGRNEALDLFPIIKYVQEKYLTDEDKEYDSVLFSAPLDNKIAMASPIEVLDSPLKKSQYDLKIEWDFSDIEQRESILYNAFYNYFHLIKDSKEIKEFIEKIGRNYIPFLDIVVQENDFFCEDIPLEVYALNQSDNLNSLLPTEVALLNDPDLEIVFYKNFIEKKLLSYQLWGIEREISENVDLLRAKVEKMSPMIICLDTSGSMRGITEVMSKAFTLAIINILESKKVPFILCKFAFDVKFIDFKKSYKKGDIFKICLNELKTSFYSGTNFDNLIVQLHRRLTSKILKASNILIISDFTFKNLSGNTPKLIKSLKDKYDIRVHGLNISEKMFQNPTITNEFKTYWSYTFMWEGLVHSKDSLVYEIANANIVDKTNLGNVQTFGILKLLQGKQSDFDEEKFRASTQEKIKNMKTAKNVVNAGNNIIRNI